MHHTWTVFSLIVYIQRISDTACSPSNEYPYEPRHLSELVWHILHWLGDRPRWSQTYYNCSHGAPIQVIRDPSYSKCRPGWTPRVWYSPEIDASKFTLRLLSHTPGGSWWLKYILLMEEVTIRLKHIWRTGWWRSIRREERQNLMLHTPVNSW